MGFLFIRTLFVLISMGVGYGLAYKLTWFNYYYGIVGAIVGFASSLFVLMLEPQIKKVSLKGIVVGTIGLLTGLLVANLIALSFNPLAVNKTVASAIRLALNLVLGYLGMIIALKKRDEFTFFIPSSSLEKKKETAQYKILDTSVIIDGRIADICETGFLEGALVIPRFVLRELQQIADSPDALKRNRGRRGLDILNKIRKNVNMEVEIQDMDFPEIEGVDGKLVKLSKVLKGKVLTNDYNLNKVAKLQGVQVLNINELANALKPVILPGETMVVQLIKEGKESGQGVGYLDDGTMVVVEEGRSKLGQKVEVLVTSVLQTSAGRMIFARLPESTSPRRERRNSRRARNE